MVEITLLRIFTHHLVNTFLPTACLIIIAEMTLFIDTGHFEATIMVALTSMLVMYTMYQNISVHEEGKRLDFVWKYLSVV